MKNLIIPKNYKTKTDLITTQLEIKFVKDEFEKLLPATVFVSATPGPYELTVCGNQIIEQVIRPTGLVDPKVYIHPTSGQIDHLVEKITEHKNRGERTLVLALTKKTAPPTHPPT